jgi:hypothetical protein
MRTYVQQSIVLCDPSVFVYQSFLHSRTISFLHPPEMTKEDMRIWRPWDESRFRWAKDISVRNVQCRGKESGGETKLKKGRMELAHGVVLVLLGGNVSLELAERLNEFRGVEAVYQVGAEDVQLYPRPLLPGSSVGC